MIATAEQTLRLVIIEDVFKRGPKRVKFVDRVATGADLIKAELAEAGGPWRLIVDGKVTDHGADISDAVEVVAVKLAGAPLIPFIIFAIVSAVVSAAVGYVAAQLFGPSKPKVNNADPETEGSNVYTFGGITNSYTQGSPIAVQFGEHDIGGQVIQIFKRNAGGDSMTEYLWMVIALEFGPVTAIGDKLKDYEALVSKGSFHIDFDTGASLGTSEFWTMVSGVDGINITGSQAVATLSAGDTKGAFTARHDLFLSGDNLSVEATWAAFGAAKIAIALNLTDGNNFHGLEMIDATHWQAFKMVAGARTNYGSAVCAVGDTLRLWRYDDILTVEVNGVAVATYDADLTISGNNDGGLVKTAFSNVTNTKVDDFILKGAIYHPKGLRINGIEARSIRGVKSWLRFGRKEQVALPASFSKVRIAYEPDLSIIHAWTQYEFRDTIKDFDVNVRFPTGLYNQSTGTIANESVVIDIQYQKDDATSFAAVAGSPFTITEKVTTGFTRTIALTGLANGDAQKFRIRRRNNPKSDTDQRIADVCRLDSVNEVTRDDRQTYPDMAMVALQIKASDQLSGGRPEVITKVKGQQCPTWAGPDANAGTAAEPLLTLAYSTNPAWVSLWILLDKQRGLGNWVTLQDIDFERLYEWAVHCDETVTYSEAYSEPLYVTRNTEAMAVGQTYVIITDATDAGNFAVDDYVVVELERINRIISKVALGDGRTKITMVYGTVIAYSENLQLRKVEIKSPAISEARHTFDGVFDSEGSVWDALLRVAKCGRAIPVRIGNKISWRWERARDVSQTINESNMVKDSYEITYVGSINQVDEVEVQYLNKDKAYDQDFEIGGGIPPADVVHMPVRRQEQRYGIVRPSHCRREANYLFRAMRLPYRKCKFEMALEGIAFEPGDVVRIGSWLNRWSHWTGKGRGTLESIYLSHEIILEPDVIYKAMVRLSSNLPGQVVTITSPAGTYAPGTPITTDAAAMPEFDSAAITIGDATIYWRDFVIVQTQLTKEITMRLECIEYVAEVYDLIGWTLGAPKEPPDGCLDTGQTFLNFDLFNIQPPASCAAIGATCFDGVITVVITGSGAACVTVVTQTGSGIIIEVDAGCGLQTVCIKLSLSGRWFYTGCGNCGPCMETAYCIGTHQTVTQEICYTLCP